LPKQQSEAPEAGNYQIVPNPLSATNKANAERGLDAHMMREPAWFRG
jgi:hypothetical protein